MNILFDWVAFSSCMGLATLIINYKKIDKNNNGDTVHHLFTWLGFPLWFPLCFLVALYQKIRYKISLKKYWQASVSYLFSGKKLNY